MNETIRSILNRRSIRSYKSSPVEKEKLEVIVKCGQFAPSANNRQPWHFSVINRAMLDKISSANRQVLANSEDENVRQRAKDPTLDSFRGAPAAIIVSGDKAARFAAADCANAVQNMAVAAYSLGLGSCYIASFKIALEREEGFHLLSELGIPQGYVPFYALAIGYSDEELGDRAPRREGTVTWLD